MGPPENSERRHPPKRRDCNNGQRPRCAVGGQRRLPPPHPYQAADRRACGQARRLRVSATTIYTLAALGSLWPRIARHFAEAKRCRWHIDYSTSIARPDAAWVAFTDKRMECFLAEGVSVLTSAEVWPPGFGSSDCRCAGHLLKTPEPPDSIALEDIPMRMGLRLQSAPIERFL